MADLTMTQARRHFGALVRRTRASGERITITDRGRPAAVLLSPEALAELEEALALAELQVARAGASGETTVPHAEVRRRLGLT
jgi:prevent-host-death family protein